MKNLVIGLIALGTISAQASMLEINGPLDNELYEAEIHEEKSYFETLGDLFKTGTRPNLSKISNIAWAGRCFSKNTPNEPTNAGYIIRQKRNDAGPIAARSKAYEAFSYWSLEQAPNFYDKMDVEQVFATHKKMPANDVRVRADSIEIDLTAPDKSNLKVSGNYLVEELSGPVKDVGPLGEVVTGIRCYYFIPDLNN